MSNRIENADAGILRLKLSVALASEGAGCGLGTMRVQKAGIKTNAPSAQQHL